jgi:hypothetical protein
MAPGGDDAPAGAAVARESIVVVAIHDGFLANMVVGWHSTRPSRRVVASAFVTIDQARVPSEEGRV